MVVPRGGGGVTSSGAASLGRTDACTRAGHDPTRCYRRSSRSDWRRHPVRGPGASRVGGVAAVVCRAQTIRAEVLRHLFVEIQWPVHLKGVRLRGAGLADPLTLSRQRCAAPPCPGALLSRQWAAGDSRLRECLLFGCPTAGLRVSWWLSRRCCEVRKRS
jgi:hypothetical protein